MIYARIAAAVALLAAIVWVAIATYSAGKKAGQSAVQIAWDADKSKIQAVADAAIAKATKDKETALAANEVISNDYQAQLLAARALSDSLAQRLRQYASHPANSGSVPKAGDRPYPTDPSSQAGDVRLTNALGAALAECSANTAQLDALIIELKPQL